MNAILSIKPQFVEEIIAGRKRFEFRKQGFRKPVHTVYIYASSPVCRIVGEFELGDILMATPTELWEMTRLYSGISKHYFDEYFQDHKTAFALEIKALKYYSEPINPYSLGIGFKAPQSFCYVDPASKLFRAS